MYIVGLALLASTYGMVIASFGTRRLTVKLLLFNCVNWKPNTGTACTYMRRTTTASFDIKRPRAYTELPRLDSFTMGLTTSKQSSWLAS